MLDDVSGDKQHYDEFIAAWISARKPLKHGSPITSKNPETTDGPNIQPHTITLAVQS